MNREEPSAPVPPDVSPGDKQAEEDLWQRHKAERGVWTKQTVISTSSAIGFKEVGGEE